jgi:hypothetical protein
MAWQQNGPPNIPFTINWNSPQAKGLVGWWPCAGSFGTQGIRELISGYSAAFPGGGKNPAWSSRSQLGPGLSYTLGTPTWMQASVPALTNITIAIWCAMTAIPGDGFTEKVFGLDDASTTRHYIDLQRIGSTIITRMVINNAAVCSDPTNHSINTPYHLAGSYNQVNIRHYVNGVAQTPTAYSTAMIATTTATTGSDKTHQTSRSFTGLIWETRVYNYAMSPSAIAALYDPATRWDLYQPVMRQFAVKLPATARNLLFAEQMRCGME